VVQEEEREGVLHWRLDHTGTLVAQQLDDLEHGYRRGIVRVGQIVQDLLDGRKRSGPADTG